ncbi:MAG: hypothetical protein ACHQ52_06655 [Candidatus Eisenbacteria bacterium]
MSIALLGLAAATHFKHHLDDPECGSTPFPSHVCFCAGLHGGVLGEQIFTPSCTIRVVAHVVVLEPCSRAAVDPAGVRATRAPPPA